MKLETNLIDIDDLQWLTLMVLFSQPDQQQALAHLESLMFDTAEIYEH
jgi:Smg protein